MKKVVLVGAIALLGLASCKKDYTCECTVSAGGLTLSSEDLKYTISNSTKSNAETKCAEMRGVAEATVVNNPDVTATCNLNN